MTVLGFHGGSHCQPGHADKLRDAGAAVVFDDMRQLPELVRQLGARPLPAARHSGAMRSIEPGISRSGSCLRITPE